MKRRIAVFFVLLMSTVLLCGCFGETDKVFEKNGLSITLPKEFTDRSEEAYAKTLDFLYTYGGTGFLGVREKKSDFPAGYENMGLEPYAKFVILGNGLNCELTKKDGLFTFSYTKNAPEGDLTYIAIVLEEKDAYWTVQAYCLSSFYEENADFLWKHLKTAKIG